MFLLKRQRGTTTWLAHNSVIYGMPESYLILLLLDRDCTGSGQMASIQNLAVHITGCLTIEI